MRRWLILGFWRLRDRVCSRLKLERQLALYYFDVADADPSIPCDGIELGSLAAARATARDYAGALLQEQPPLCSQGEYLTLTVSDAQRLTLFTITVLTSDAPVLNDPSRKTDRRPSEHGLRRDS